MDPLDRLAAVVAEGRTIRAVDDGIYSVLPEVSHGHLYDRRAAMYDFVVGTRLYNRIMWGTCPLDYVAFARQAVASESTRPMLDAGCGSLLFTAEAYLECNRQVIGFDQSVRMLQHARRRIRQLAGSVPENILLLQGDLSDLPFRPDRFATILCLNVLHQIADAARLIPNLNALLTSDGHLYLTSLVSNSRFVGDHYLSVLYKTGEFVRPRSSVELKRLLSDSLGAGVNFETKGNMAFATTAPFTASSEAEIL